jgi:hypothetical protein
MGIGALFILLVVVSVGFGIFSIVASRARKRELQRLDEREEALRREGKID